MKACLKDAGIEASKIDELVLVGGMTRMLKVVDHGEITREQTAATRRES